MNGRQTALDELHRSTPFALHKYWIGHQPERDPLKRDRDIEQAKAVARVAREYLALPFEAKALSALPIELVKEAKELVRITTKRAKTIP